MSALRINAMFLLGALVVQYALGMYVNMFVSFPTSGTNGQFWEFAWSQWSVAAHIILGILLLIGAIVLCIRAYRSKNKKWINGSFLGFIAIFAAGASGAAFIPSQTDAYSLSMALWFLLAFAAYCWVLFTSKGERTYEEVQ